MPPHVCCPLQGSACDATLNPGTSMKSTTKLLHLIWAGCICAFVLWATWLNVSRSILRAEPFWITPAIAALGWLTFAVGLFCERVWAWYGSLIFSVLSLLAVCWVTLLNILIISPP